METVGLNSASSAAMLLKMGVHMGRSASIQLPQLRLIDAKGELCLKLCKQMLLCCVFSCEKKMMAFLY